MKSMLAMALLAATLLGACSRLEGRSGPGDDPETRGGIEDRRKVGVPGSD